MISKKLLLVLIGLIILIVMVVMFVFLLSLHKPDTRHKGLSTAIWRMNYITSAIFNYYISHGHYPFSDECKFSVSWRALILPMLSPEEYDELVATGYSPNMSWDSEVNTKAREYLPVNYRSLYNRKCKNTIMVAIKSDRGIFNKGDEIPLDSLDYYDLDNILSFIEVADSGINWLEPRDLTEHDLDKIRTVHKVNGKKCIVISMISGRTYVLTIENFRQVCSALITVERGKKIIKKQNGNITTIKVSK
jgi:hypothetical protein